MSDDLKLEAARAALDEIRDGMIVGLGSGSTASIFIRELGKSGRKLLGIPTSDESGRIAHEVGIPLTTFDAHPEIDVTIDGADEVSPQLDLTKGLGGALVREKIVAAAARRFIVLVGEEKLVKVLGVRKRLPVEVVPFAVPFVTRRLTELGYPPELRPKDGQPWETDNGNLILDAAVTTVPDPAKLDRTLLDIPGVVGTGLFVGMAHLVMVWQEGRARTLTKH